MTSLIGLGIHSNLIIYLCDFVFINIGYWSDCLESSDCTLTDGLSGGGALSPMWWACVLKRVQSYATAHLRTAPHFKCTDTLQHFHYSAVVLTT